MKNNHNTSVLFASIFLILSIFGLLYISYSILRSPENTETSNSNASSAIVNNQIGIAKFTGEESFKEYLESSNATTNSSYFALSKDSIAPTMAESSLGSGSSPSSADRYSETNIQVAGVDEADWVKTNGKNIFVSNVFGNVVNYDLPVEKYSLDAMVSPSNVIMNSSTKIFDTLPVDKIKELSEIDFAGNMLLTENLLVVMDYQKIKTYDISNTSEPKKVWDMKLEDSNIVSSRLIGNELVVVFSKYLGTDTPCLIPLYQMTYLEQDTKLTNIPCQNIYYPENQNTNNLITVTRFNASNGEVKAQTSYLSSQYSSYIYVSLKNIYLTYNNSLSDLELFKLMLNDSDFKALVSEKDPNALSKINRILGYDISDYSKFNEISPIMQTIFTTEKDSATMQEMVLNIIKRNTGKIQTTQIVKFDLSNLEIVAKAEVSGNLLNQFAMDEYNDTFRLSTTVDDWRLNNISNTTIRNNENTSTSYSYILDSDLKLLSKLGDLGNGERIYSARYIGEKLYLVTFRQTDPFYVIDLKDPKDIKKVGELKIPGFSSYLHPITENLILGVGQENGKLKLSMFDVSDDTNPVEISKLFLEGWGSDVQYDHHAFLLDKQNKYFVIPSYNGSFLVSYDEKGNLSEQKKLGSEQENFSRSLFINDYLYLVSNQRMFIYDIKNKFEKVNSVKFN